MSGSEHKLTSCAKIAKAVVAGDIPACRWVKPACQSQLDDEILVFRVNLCKAVGLFDVGDDFRLVSFHCAGRQGISFSALRTCLTTFSAY